MGIIHLQAKDDFTKLVLESTVPVLLDFWAPWCGPCRIVAPELDTLAGIMQDKLQIVKINVDDFAEIAQKNKIISIPTMIIYKEGREQERIIGFRPYRDIQKALEKIL